MRQAFDRLNTLPLGTFRARSGGRVYLVSVSFFNNGKSRKLVAEQLGGGDYISANAYDLGTGPRVFPCEMPLAKVIEFLCNLDPDAP